MDCKKNDTFEASQHIALCEQTGVLFWIKKLLMLGTSQKSINLSCIIWNISYSTVAVVLLSWGSTGACGWKMTELRAIYIYMSGSGWHELQGNVLRALQRPRLTAISSVDRGKQGRKFLSKDSMRPVPYPFLLPSLFPFWSHNCIHFHVCSL